jgi:hypothetical protein
MNGVGEECPDSAGEAEIIDGEGGRALPRRLMREEHLLYSCDCIYQLETALPGEQRANSKDWVIQNVMQILAGTEG